MKLLCLLGVHKWMLGILVTDKKGTPSNLYRRCERCHKIQVTIKPKKYHPVKYEWVAYGEKINVK